MNRLILQFGFRVLLFSFLCCYVLASIRKEVSSDDLQGMPPIFKAIYAQNERDLQLLLNDKLVWGTLYQGMTLFHFLALTGNTNILAMLVRYSSKKHPIPRDLIDKRDTFGNTPVMLAIKRKHAKIVGKLILAGFDPFIGNYKGKNLLDYLFKRPGFGSIEILCILDALLEKYPSVSWKSTVHRLAQCYLEDSVPQAKLYEHIFLEACRWGCPSIVNHLLSEMMDWAVCTDNKETGLHLAVKAGHVAVLNCFSKRPCIYMKDLLQKRDVEGNTPVHLAALQGDVSLTKHLFGMISDWERKHFMQLTNSAHETVFHCALRSQKVGIIKLVQLLVSIDSYCLQRKGGLRSDEPIMHFAARHSIKEVVSFLIDKGLSLKEKDGCRGLTPLHCAVEEGNTDAIRLIISCDIALAHIKSTFGTALALAMFVGRKESIQVLLEYLDREACVNFFDCNGASPFRLAVEQGQIEIVALMINKGADLEMIEKGKKIIEYAPERLRGELMQLVKK